MARKRTGKRVEVDDGYRVVGKAANGDGTVFWDTSIGAWRTRWRDVNGRKRTTSGPTKEAALAKRAAKDAATVAARHPGGPLGDDPTVETLAEWWLGMIGPTVRAGTRRAYRNDVKRIVDQLGAMPLEGLDRATVRGFINGLSAKMAASTVKNTRTRLSSVCKAGIELGVLDRNPTEGVKVPVDPPARRRRKRALEVVDTHRLLGVLDAKWRWDAAVAILYTSGVRASEALGLAWDDVDLVAGTARIRRGVTYLGADEGTVIDAPKTTRTYGTIHLAPTAVDLLRSHRKLRGDEDRTSWPSIVYEGEPLDMIFLTARGALGRQQYLYRAVGRALGRAGVAAERIGTHTGRRTVITSLYQAGVPLSDIADLVGHASIATTARYVVDLGDRPAQTAAKAAALLDPAAGEHPVSDG